MKRKHYYLLGILLLSCLWLLPYRTMAQHKVTMTTANKVGSLLDRDDFWVNEGVEGDYTIDGLTKINASTHRIDKQDIVITGFIKKLNCGDINLTKLDVTQAPELVDLDCRGNRLTAIDVSKNTKLSYLACGQKGLKSVDIGALKELSFFNCSRSPIKQLNLKNNTKLKSLYAFECEMDNLDLSSLELLTTLYCNGNKLTKLDVSANPDLENLICGDNKIKSLDLTKNDKLALLSCSMNGMERLLISSKATGIQGLTIFGNRLNREAMETFILSLPMQQENSTKVTVVNTTDPNEKNVFTSLHALMMTIKGWSPWDFKGGPDEEQYGGEKDDTPYIILQATNTPAKIGVLELDAVGTIHRIGIDGAPGQGTASVQTKYALIAGNVKGLKLTGAKLAALDLSRCPALERLDCSNNKITSLKLAASTPQLKELVCSHNHLRELDLKSLTKLEVLECGHNQLSGLDLSANIELKKLCYEDNLIRDISLDKQKKLRYLQNYQNGIDRATMAGLVNQLPEVKSPEEGLLCPVQVKGRNGFDEDLHKKAKAKGWKVVMADEQGNHKQYTGIEHIVEHSLGIQYDLAGQLLTISAGAPQSPVRIYTTDGRLVAEGQLDALGYWAYSFAGFEARSCIVWVSGRSVKIALD